MPMAFLMLWQRYDNLDTTIGQNHRVYRIVQGGIGRLIKDTESQDEVDRQKER